MSRVNLDLTFQQPDTTEVNNETTSYLLLCLLIIEIMSHCGPEVNLEIHPPQVKHYYIYIYMLTSTVQCQSIASIPLVIGLGFSLVCMYVLVLGLGFSLLYVLVLGLGFYNFYHIVISLVSLVPYHLHTLMVYFTLSVLLYRQEHHLVSG